MNDGPVVLCTCGHLRTSHGRRDVQLVGGGEVPTCWVIDCRCPAWTPVTVAP